MENSKPPTLHDVAKKAGVSPSTVSRVMHGNPSVKTEVRNKVENALRELNYYKSKTAGSKKKSGGNIIGLIVPDILNPFFPLLIKGIENIAKIQGYSVILCDSENDCEIEEKHIKNLLQKGIDGLIFVPSPGKNAFINDLINEQVDFPLVFLDRKIENEHINFVTSANEEGAYHAVKYLLSLGHRKIVYIAGEKYLSTEKERFNGYKKAIQEESINLNESLILNGHHNWDDSYKEVSRLIESGAPFTAIFASSDIMAFGAKQALEDRNLKIPNDISIIGYDDIPFSSAISLTTVSQPAYEMGKNAMLLLIDLINKRVQTPHHIVLRPSMIIRGSCMKR